MIQVQTTRVFKPYKQKPHIYDESKEVFKTLQEAREALKERYGKCKRSKVYKDPDAKHIGYVYHFRADGGYEEHWTHFREFTDISPK